jgi:GntR family transcriptional regulator
MLWQGCHLMSNLDRRSYVPLYRQLVDSIASRIDSGELKPGDRVPSERELAEDLRVSRITVRQALTTLEQAGLVYREQGRGTFVAELKLYRVEGFGSFTEYTTRQGLRPQSRIVSQELIDASELLQSRLKLQPNEQVLRLVRIRLADDAPLALQSAYLPCSLCPGLEHEDLDSRSLYDVLREKYSVYPTWTEPDCCAAAASPTEANALGLEPGAPVLVVNALTYTETFEVVEQVRTVYRGADFRLYLGRQRVTK